MAQGGIERRGAARYKVHIAARVTELATHATVQAVCNDISVSGCFIVTANPNPTGTLLRINLEHDGSVFESAGRVAYSVWAEGMGIALDSPIPQAKLIILKGWIADAAAAAAKTNSLSGIIT